MAITMTLRGEAVELTGVAKCADVPGEFTHSYRADGRTLVATHHLTIRCPSPWQARLWLATFRAAIRFLKLEAPRG